MIVGRKVKNVTFAAPEHVYKLVEIYKQDHNFSEMVCTAILPILIKNTGSEGIRLRLDQLLGQKKTLEEKQQSELSQITSEISDLQNRLELSSRLEQSRAEQRIRFLERAKASPDWFTSDGWDLFSAWAKGNTQIIAACGFESSDAAYRFVRDQITRIPPKTSVSTEDAAAILVSARKEISRQFIRNNWVAKKDEFIAWTATDRGTRLISQSGWSVEEAYEVHRRQKEKEEAVDDRI
ncbi:hypothetical protein A3207_00640 [Candidatus Methanomassiliicoccus intestinalis]|uniref:Uncharacterized protein n=1 Tax=Candidatus Methanomassiliicoccus intestinalis TaxID=1406512 RepID=A0A8J8PH06_9ARCH|nr:MAG: hypothetical protein A3207_00640 [Candidatus Methanomassiliicoccus intestinalis]